MIPFMKAKWISLSTSILVIGFTFYYTNALGDGFRKGIDFAGGIKLEVEINEKVTVESLRGAFEKIEVAATVQKAGQGISNLAKIEIGAQQEIQLQADAENHRDELEQSEYSVNSVDYLKFLLVEELTPKDPSQVNIIGANHVGPTVGDYLRKSSIKLMLITLALITVYITFRFRFTYAIGALSALLHDLFMTLGFIGLLQVPLSIPVVAALLTILGYSINDTIVIFDRIRENMRGNEKVSFEKMVDRSINESLSRTIITSMTTLVAITSVYVLAGDNLKDMAFVLIIGIIIGTYSSSFIASPIVVIWNKISNR